MQVDLLHPSAADERPGEPEAALWAFLLWNKGMKHRNHQVSSYCLHFNDVEILIQVQRLVLRTFLERKWSGALLRSLPDDFMFDALLPCVASDAVQTDPSHFNQQVLTLNLQGTS